MYSYYGNSRSSNVEEERGSPANPFGRFIRGLRRISFSRALVVLAVVIVLGILLSANTSPIIRLSHEDTTARSADAYRDETERILKSSVLNRTKVTFDYTGVEEELKKSFPEVEDARVTFDVFGRRPVVQLALYSPSFRVDSNGAVWVVDSRGVSIGKQEDMGKDLTTLPLVKDEIGLAKEPGTSLMSPGEVTFLASVLDILAEKSLSVSGIFIPRTPKELDIQLAGEGFRYRLNTDEKAGEQAGALLAARDTLSGRSEVPVEYVDLRPGEKIFWK